MPHTLDPHVLQVKYPSILKKKSNRITDPGQDWGKERKKWKTESTQ